MDLLKRSSPHFSGFSVQAMVLVNPFLRFTKMTDFFLLKSAVLRAGVPEWLLTLGPPCLVMATFSKIPEKTKAYTTTTERKSFGELFWPQRKTFQAGGGYKNSIKTRKPYPPLKSFLCGPHFFLQRKVLHWSRAVYGFFFPGFLLLFKEARRLPTQLLRAALALAVEGAKTIGRISNRLMISVSLRLGRARPRGVLPRTTLMMGLIFLSFIAFARESTRKPTKTRIFRLFRTSCAGSGLLQGPF